MLDWLGLEPFIFTVLRVSTVWLAFYGAGLPLIRLPFIHNYFKSMPAIIPGMIFYSIIALILSLFSVMTRTAISIVLIPGTIWGLLKFVQSIRTSSLLQKKPNLLQFSLSLVWVLIILSSLMFASIPNVQFDDPLIIYAVRPDLWLSAGNIHWLNETTFSGFPFMGELISIFPAALSSDRLDQLSVLQVFQFSMLIASVILGFQLLGVKKKLFFVTAICITHISLLSIVASYAKTDITSMLFITIAFTSLLKLLLSKSFSPDYTPFFALGLAFTAKLTSGLFLIPFVMYAFVYFKKRFSVRILSWALLSLAVMPVLFGVRTLIETGSPTYPVYPFKSLLKDEYQMTAKPEELIRANDRDRDSSFLPDYSFAKNITMFFAMMEGAFLLLLAGVFYAISKKSASAWLILPILVYSALAIFIYWPPWWGSKYTIQFFPFVGILGAYYLSKFAKRPLLTAIPVLLVSIIIPGFIISPSISSVFPISFRTNVTTSFISGKWQPGSVYHTALNFQSPEVITHLEMNEFIPENSTILSLHQEKRYFSDNTVIVAWRHPLTLPLFLENSLSDEISILKNLDVDYVTFLRNDPLPFELENDVILLDHIGTGMILEPVHVVQGFLICRFNPEGN